MNLNVGGNIKKYRLALSMTQDQLAQKMGVSAQAVSKWESGANMPDIQLLPELSVIFGVTIDALFDLTDDSRMERIENMLEDVRFLSQEEFRNTESYLKDRVEKNRNDLKPTLLLAQLYNKRAEEYHQLAAPLARRAAQEDPNCKEAHNAVFTAENGPAADWNATNHHVLIQFYQKLVAKQPGTLRIYFWLLDLLIADGRTWEARKYAEAMKKAKHTFHYEMYMGDICKAECDLPAALNWWNQMTEREIENWLVWATYGDRMAKLCRYEEAICAYEKAMPLRPVPRFIDCEQAIGHIYEIQGNYSAAIEMKKKEIQLTREDWQITEGELLEAAEREIRRLQEKL